MLTEHKRVKHGEAPGNLHRRWLIALRELRGEYTLQPFPWQALDERDGKALRRGLADKSRKVQRRRDQKAIMAGLDDRNTPIPHRAGSAGTERHHEASHSAAPPR